MFAHRVDVPLHEGSYRWSGGKSVTVFDNTVIAHLTHSTPEEFRFTSTDFNSYITVSTADGAPRRIIGYMEASTCPGLGVTPKMDVLVQRVVDVF
jgi:hypothetical protein